MTLEEARNLPEEELNKHLIKSTEARIADYKLLLADVGRNRDKWPPEDPTTVWFKALIRDQKNQDETWLGIIRDKQKWTRQGLNPPYCYPPQLRFLDDKKALTIKDLLETNQGPLN